MGWEEIANGPIIWLCGFLLGGFAGVGAYLMYRKARDAALKMGYDKKWVRDAVKASAITVIGPSLGIVVGMVGLIILLTPGIAWLRESAGIGSIMYELITATYGASALGKSFGPELTQADFLVVLAAMSVPCTVWLVGLIAATPGAAALKDRMTKKDPKIWGLLAIVMMLVAFSNLWAENLLKGTPWLLAGLISFAIATTLFELADRLKKPRLKEYVLTIAILVAIFLARWIWTVIGG